MSSKPSHERLFIALLPPLGIQAYANEIKQYCAEQFNSQAAQKSPPHITLQPPFEWPKDEMPTLQEHLTAFAHSHSPIPIVLDGFSAFPPRVLFINVLKTPELLILQKALKNYLENTLAIADRKTDTRPFAPHLTVAFRDLTQQNFKLAWQEFQTKSLHFEFVASHLTLLIYINNHWNISQEFPLDFS